MGISILKSIIILLIFCSMNLAIKSGNSELVTVSRRSDKSSLLNAWKNDDLVHFKTAFTTLDNALDIYIQNQIAESGKNTKEPFEILSFLVKNYDFSDYLSEYYVLILTCIGKKWIDSLNLLLDNSKIMREMHVKMNVEMFDKLLELGTTSIQQSLLHNLNYLSIISKEKFNVIFIEINDLSVLYEIFNRNELMDKIIRSNLYEKFKFIATIGRQVHGIFDQKLIDQKNAVFEIFLRKPIAIEIPSEYWADAWISLYQTGKYDKFRLAIKLMNNYEIMDQITELDFNNALDEILKVWNIYADYSTMPFFEQLSSDYFIPRIPKEKMTSILITLINWNHDKAFLKMINKKEITDMISNFHYELIFSQLFTTRADRDEIIKTFASSSFAEKISGNLWTLLIIKFIENMDSFDKYLGIILDSEFVLKRLSETNRLDIHNAVMHDTLKFKGTSKRIYDTINQAFDSFEYLQVPEYEANPAEIWEMLEFSVKITEKSAINLIIKNYSLMDKLQEYQRSLAYFNLRDNARYTGSLESFQKYWWYPKSFKSTQSAKPISNSIQKNGIMIPKAKNIVKNGILPSNSRNIAAKSLNTIRTL